MTENKIANEMHVSVDDLKRIIVTGKARIAASVSPDKDSDESKKFTLEFDLVKIPANEILSDGLTRKRINWANSNRPKFSKLVEGLVKLVYTRPGTMIIDPELEIGNRLAAMADPVEREKYIAELIAKASA